VDVIELAGFARLYRKPLSFFVIQHDDLISLGSFGGCEQPILVDAQAGLMFRTATLGHTLAID